MDETETFPSVARAVALQAQIDGVARVNLSGDEVYEQARQEIAEARNLTRHLMDEGYIAEPTPDMLQECLERTIAQMG